MTAVVIDASAGVEIVGNTARGRALVGLLSPGSQGWVPEHFYAEVIGALRRRLLVEKVMTEAQALAAVGRLESWNLREASIRPLVGAAWNHRHNIAAPDALYVALAEHLGAQFLTDDHRLVSAPTFPRHIEVLSLPKPTS